MQNAHLSTPYTIILSEVHTYIIFILKKNKLIAPVIQVISDDNLVFLSDMYDNKLVLTFQRNLLPPNSG
jgi:hypothetical protein